MPSIINATTTNGLVTSADNSGSLQLQTNSGTTAVTIDTSQRVGIGTNAPTYQVEIKSTDPRMALNNSNYGTWFSSAGWTGANDYSVVQAGTAERFRLSSDGNLMFNSGYGSVATAYGCRAWVNFDGDPITIRASGNVSSITDNGVGDYTINFTTAMPDANYSIVGGFSREPVGGGNSTNTYNINTNNTTGADVAPTTSGFRVAVLVYGVGGRDINYINLAVFR